MLRRHEGFDERLVKIEINCRTNSKIASQSCDDLPESGVMQMQRARRAARPLRNSKIRNY